FRSHAPAAPARSTLSLHDALPIYGVTVKLKSFTDYTQPNKALANGDVDLNAFQHYAFLDAWNKANKGSLTPIGKTFITPIHLYSDRKSTRLNSSHVSISYAVFCLK